VSPLRGLIAALLLLLQAAAACALDISLSLDSIRHPAFAAERVSMQPQAGGTVLRIGALRIGGREFRDLQLKCREFNWDGGDIRCRGGAAKVGTPGVLPAGRAGGTVALDFNYVAARKTLDLKIHDVPATAFVGPLPELASWQPKGTMSGSLRFVGSHAEFDLVATGLAFANAEGSRAGEGIALHLTGTASEASGAWAWQVSAAWQGGEAFIQPWYLKGAGQTLVASGAVDADELRIDKARFEQPGIGTLDGRLRWDRRNGQLAALEVASDSWNAAPAFEQWVQPLLGETPRVRPLGTARFAFAVDAAGPRSLDLDLDLSALDVGEGRMALADLRATVPWRREGAGEARITSSGGHAGELPLGDFNVPLAMNGWNLSFDQVELPLLDGRVLFENLRVQREAGQWRWQLAGALHPLSMPLLTERLGLPRMEGLLSASIPRIQYENGVLALDGALVVSVFDGYLSAAGLKIIEPFGRAPRLVADIDARHLDLAMLTNTYSFGSITGYIDAEVRGLEMLGWQPQAFAARIETSPGDFGKRISQRAVQNISSLGGAGAGAAIQRSFLRFFDTFGYDRIGLSCTLVGGVCEMGGLAETSGGYLMVKGGGLPALNVMGYNRRVGWDVLVSRLRAIAAGNSRPVIE
jgi:hypothetical protein